MDFALVMKSLLSQFERRQIRCAAIGGFALGLLGYPRQTMDLDFLVHRDDLKKLDELLQTLGYRQMFRTENVSQYRHDDDAWGSIDVIHAFRKISLAMLQRAKSYPAFGGTQSIKAVDPEDVIGLKVQAMFNDPTRRSQEVADIERLAMLYGRKLDWERVEEFYDLFGLGEEAKALKDRFGHAH